MNDRKQRTYPDEFLKYTFLNILGMLGLSCYILADTFFISKGLGAQGLAALNLALPVYSVINGSGLMLGMGGATKYSILKGQGSYDHADCVFTHTVLLAAVFAAVFFGMGCFGAQKLTVLLGADADVFAMTSTYLKVILLFSPAFILNNILVCFVRNDGGPGLSMTAMLCGSFSNIIFDYLFIFPFQLGIFGAVLATGWSPLVSMAVLSVYKRKKQNHFHFRKERLRLSTVLPVVSLGFPSFITEVSSGIVMLVFNRIILGLEGNVGVAAYGVIANLALVAVSVHTGAAQGMQPLASRSYGEGNGKKTKQTLRYGMLTAVLLSAAVYLTAFVFAEPVTRIFNSEGNARLQEIAVYGMRLYFLSVPFAGFNIVLSSYLTSTERAVPAHVISVSRGLVLMVPAALVLAKAAGLTGVWLAVPVTEGIVCLFGMALLFSGSRNCFHFGKTL